MAKRYYRHFRNLNTNTQEDLCINLQLVLFCNKTSFGYIYRFENCVVNVYITTKEFRIFAL